VQGILTWSEDSILRRWDLNGSLVGEIPEVELPVAVNGNGSEAVAMSRDNRVLAINLEAYDKVPKSGLIAGQQFICFSDAQQILYSIKDGKRIQRWSIVTGRNLGAFRDLGLAITAVLPDAQDEKVIAGTESGEIVIYMVGSGINVADLRGHKSAVRAIGSEPSGSLWATGSDDCSVRLWDVESQRCLAVMEGHSAPVRSVSVFPNLSLVASGAADGSVRLWGLEWQFSVQ
jgi:WD40 repeat protein